VGFSEQNAQIPDSAWFGLSNKNANLRSCLLSIEGTGGAADTHGEKLALQAKEAGRRLEDGIKDGAETTGKSMLEASLSVKTSSDYLELDAAFSELLRQRGNDLQELEELIVTNLRTLIDPALCRIRRTRLTKSQMKWLNTIESHLNGIVSPLTTRLS
jgi:hypothetical protein